MSTPAEGPPHMEGQGAPQQYAYDPRSNGLSRRRTDEQDAQSSANSLAQQNRTDAPPRSSTDPDQQAVSKPKRSGKICGKCGEGLTGQFVRALGDTYHLECFTCHVSSPISFVVWKRFHRHDVVYRNCSSSRAAVHRGLPLDCKQCRLNCNIIGPC